MIDYSKFIEVKDIIQLNNYIYKDVTNKNNTIIFFKLCKYYLNLYNTIKVYFTTENTFHMAYTYTLHNTLRFYKYK